MILLITFLIIGNHGEDVKECYYYLDSTPTHSYMKALYKYPQNEYPYSWIVQENKNRTRQQPEFEVTDTGETKETLPKLCKLLLKPYLICDDLIIHKADKCILDTNCRDCILYFPDYGICKLQHTATRQGL